MYVAPFFEKGCLGEAATAYVKALSKHFNVTARPIGKIEQNNDAIVPFLKFNNADYLIIHGKPEDFCWKGGFKKVIGITHVKCPLIEETDFSKYFGIMDEVYHDSSFSLPSVNNIHPCFDTSDYVDIKPKRVDRRFNFLIHGEPNCYEEIYSVIRAYTQEFRMEENVGLTIKLPQWFSINDFSNALRSLQSDTRKYNNPAYPLISYNNIWFSKKELLSFYHEFDCIINCSLYNKWSRPVIDCLNLGLRCISLLEESVMTTKKAYGPSEHKDYPVGESSSFMTKETGRVLRGVFSGNSTINTLNKDDFTEEKTLSKFQTILK